MNSFYVIIVSHNYEIKKAENYVTNCTKNEK